MDRKEARQRFEAICKAVFDLNTARDHGVYSSIETERCWLFYWNGVRQQPEPATGVECEDCDGKGVVGTIPGRSFDDPPEPEHCSNCGGSGRLQSGLSAQQPATGDRPWIMTGTEMPPRNVSVEMMRCGSESVPYYKWRPLPAVTGDRAEVIAGLEGMVAMHEKNGGGRSSSANALRSASAMLRAGAAPQVPPSDCANRGSCIYHRMQTDPPSNIYICHEINCPYSVKACAPTPGQEKG